MQNLDYRTARLRTIYGDARLPDNNRADAQLKMRQFYTVTGEAIMPKPRAYGSILVEEVHVVDSGGNQLLRYKQADFVKDVGLPMILHI